MPRWIGRRTIVVAALWSVIVLGFTAWWVRPRIVVCLLGQACPEPRTIWPGIAVWAAGLVVLLVLAYLGHRLRQRPQ